MDFTVRTVDSDVVNLHYGPHLIAVVDLLNPDAMIAPNPVQNNFAMFVPNAADGQMFQATAIADSLYLCEVDSVPMFRIHLMSDRAVLCFRKKNFRIQIL